MSSEVFAVLFLSSNNENKLLNADQLVGAKSLKLGVTNYAPFIKNAAHKKFSQIVSSQQCKLITGCAILGNGNQSTRMSQSRIRVWLSLIMFSFFSVRWFARQAYGNNQASRSWWKTLLRQICESVEITKGISITYDEL